MLAGLPEVNRRLCPNPTRAELGFLFLGPEKECEMQRKIKAIMRLSRRKGRQILEQILGDDAMSSGFISPEMHENLYQVNQHRKDLRL